MGFLIIFGGLCTLWNLSNHRELPGLATGGNILTRETDDDVVWERTKEMTLDIAMTTNSINRYGSVRVVFVEGDLFYGSVSKAFFRGLTEV